MLVVGGTGNLGARVVRALRGRGKRVRALVRPGTDPASLASLGVEIVRGDMTDPSSLPAAMRGISGLATTAIGYSMRKPGDSLETVDINGNQNLIDAARDSGVERFVFTSILACDRARDVPHFWAKKLTEDHLERSRVPFVAVRPGAYLGGNPMMTQGLAQGVLATFGPTDVPWTWIHPDDVAASIAKSIDAPQAVGRRIDLGTDRPVSMKELTKLFTNALGRPIRLGPPPIGMRWGNVTDEQAEERRKDMMAMGAFFASGQYVADTTWQERIFGPAPRIEETVGRVVAEAGLQRVSA